MIALDEQELFRTYAQAKQVRIESLLDQYGSSLADMRELYPKLTETIEKQRLVTTLPTQALFFIPSEAADMGLSLEEGWMLKVSPVEGGYKSSFITPSKWEITEDELYISPTGEQYSRADMEALLAIPTGEYTVPEIPVATTIDDLTDVGRVQYQEYQSSGGQLDVVGWLNLREAQQVETEQVFGKVFPEQTTDEVLNYMATDPTGFLADIREIGPTEDVITLLKSLEFQDEQGNPYHLTDEEIQELFGTTPVPEYIPESAWKDFKDSLLAGAVGTIQNIETWLLTQPVTKPTAENVQAWATRTTAIAPEFLGQYLETTAQAHYEEALRQTAEAYIRRRQQQQQYWIDHPELVPNPEYLQNPFKKPSLFLTPGYWTYSIGSSLAYSLAVMGTIVAVSAVATPFAGIPAGVLVAAMPEAGNMLDQLISMGVPVAEARQKALLGGLIAGGVEAVSDIPFIGLVFKPLRPVIQPLINTIKKITTNALAKAVITGLTIPQIEGLEEVVTQLAQNAILKHYDATQSLLEGVSQAYIQATIASLPFGAIGGMASYRTFRSSLSTETGTQLDGLVDKLQKQGLTEEQAQVQAVNELARTPEIEPDLSKAIEAAQQEYLESQGVSSVEELIPDQGIAGDILNEMRIAEEVAKKVTTPEVTGLYAKPPGRHEVPQFGEVGAVPEYTPSAEGRRRIIESRLRRGEPVSDKLLAEFPDLAQALPTAEAGMPEAGLQPSMLEEVPAKEVIPAPSGRLVQARLDDYLRLREYNKQAVTERISEIKKQLETKGRLPAGQGTKGDLRLELARLDAQQELDAVKSIEDLDLLIRQVENELGRRSLPGQGEWARSGIELARHPRKPNIFPEYTSRQLDEMRNVYLQARGKIEPATATVKAEDIPSDMPALTNTQLTPAQVEKTIELFKQAVIAPNAEMQRAAAIELRKHVLAQRAKSASESAEAMIVEGANPEEAIRMAEQMFMTGKLPDLTTDYFDDLTQEMRNVLFAKVYNYWKDKSWFELISTFDALTNTLAGKSIPRVKGIGSKYFPNGGSAWDRLARVFVGDIEVLNALDQGKSLRDVIQGVLLESGRGVVTLNQETINWLKELSTISEEDKLLLTKPLSELTEEDVRRIATSWFWSRQNELNTLLAAGTITRSEYQLELAIAKDRVFPHKPMGAATTYPTGVAGQPRLGEGYTPIEGIPETRTAEELRLAKFELEKKQREATTEPTVTPPPSEWAAYNEAFKEMPLLTLREKGTIVRTLKSVGLGVIDIGNAMRALKASIDQSFSRTTKMLVPGHPVLWYRAEIEAWTSTFSQQRAEANWQRIIKDPRFDLYEEIRQKTGQDPLRIFEVPKGTAQWRAAEEYGYLTEERAIPRFVAKIAPIKMSGRGFTTGCNVMVWGAWNKYYDATMRIADRIASGDIKLPEGEALSIYQEMADYQKYLADAVQRASLGKASGMAPALGATFFAIRSKLARLLFPRHLVSSNPRVRAQAWKDFSLFVGANSGLVMLGFWLGLWDVERDPRNAEVMSIRIGNMRIDPWAGYRQFLVLYSRLISGTGISSVTGQEYEVNPIAALTSFFRGSLAPLTSALLDFWTGKDFLGEKIDIDNPKQWLDRIAPFAIQDIYEAFLDDWQHGLIAIIPAIMGEGVQTYTGDWGENWKKLGLPKYPENTGYGIYEPVYDLTDFWADTASQFRGVDPATLTASKGFPEYVRSIATALQIIDQLDTLPNKKLTSLNADPEKGTTFMQYYQMWQDRQKIVASGDTEKLKAFDADERTRNAYLGNITQAQYALLVEYHSLPESEKADFLGRHPELNINPREEWLRTHPQENALLALWGKADVYTSEALSQISTLTKQLDIPENALVMKDLDPVTELKLKNQHLSDLLDAYGGLDDTLKGPDGLTARDRAIKGLYADNPEFRGDQRRIEAIDVGTKDNPTIESMIEGWVERGQVADEFGSSSAEMKLWLIDNKEVHQWALENGLLSDTGEDWNENILRLEVNYREDFEKYADYGNEKSPLYIANDTARADAREAMIFSNDKMTSFGVAYYTINALQKNLPENLVTTYVGYYGIRKKEGGDYSAGWYEDDWYLLEHKDFYQTMLSLGLWQSRDFSKVPTRQVYSLYQTYMGLPTGTPRLDFRAQHLDLDNWLVKAKGYTPVGSR